MACLAFTAGGLQAQEPAGSVSRVHAWPLAQLIPVITSADPIPGGAGLTEARVVQPMLGLRLGAFADRLLLYAGLNAEGWTIESGELGLGNWGEGFIDRRHPHTYLHEAVLAFTSRRRDAMTVPRLAIGAVIGNGFVPFGTDDPMSRPPVRYPVNHHWSQILERALVMAQVSYRIVMLEGALFNGDEPENPSSSPNMDRFGDSWSLRATVAPTRALELQVSRATVHSPEHRGGAGPDQDKWSASVRGEWTWATRPVYGLFEWARSEEASGAFQFESWLGEGAITLGRARPYMRLEVTERPEEERTSPFRSRRPHLENSILGTSRWTTLTGGVAVELLSAPSRFSLAPVVEGTLGHIAKSGEGLFQVADWYSRPDFWTFTVGVRAAFGLRGHRMGRYGLADAMTAHAGTHR
jgi:hypothetical protein